MVTSQHKTKVIAGIGLILVVSVGLIVAYVPEVRDPLMQALGMN